MASVVEMYGALNPKMIITFRHVDFIDAEAINREKPDVIIGADLSVPEITDLLCSREKGFTSYETLIGAEGSCRYPNLTPLAFELPIIVGTKKTMASLPDPVTVNAEELRNAAASYTTVDRDGRPTRLGFSPTWNPATFIDLLLTKDINALAFGPGNAKQELITETMEEVRQWRESISESEEADSAFDKKYRYIPDLNLLLEERISFARSDFNKWSILPEEMTKKLEIRYFRGARHIPVISIVSAGIPRNSRHSKEAEEFIIWLTQTESQIAVMNRWERDNLDVFGFFGGLSSNREVNEKVIPKRFPSFQGKIPEDHYLTAPNSFPHYWKRIRNEVIYPWYKAALADPPNTESLAEAFYRWDLSSLEETD